MSNIYILEPPTSGKVLLKTTVGDIDIELWAKEAPKACRNFVQLCMEGYYDGTIFHRIVKGFIVQGGDPSGDGTGGESIYGEPFKDEFHQRLKFVRRGLVAMANAGKDDNGSQFFFTLAATPELQNKHTIFGKVAGDTLFNMLKLAEGLLEDERPTYPHKISSTEVLNDPFLDIVPRVKPVVIEKIKKPKVRGVKNFKLLSFGAEAEEDEEEAVEENKKFVGKSKSTHDALEDPKLSSDKVEVKSAKDEGEEEEEEIDHELQLESIRKKLKVDNKKPAPRNYYAEYEEEQIENERKKRKEDILKEIKDVKREYHKNKLQKEKQNAEEKQEEMERSEVTEEYLRECDKFKENTDSFPKKGPGREEFTLNLLSKFKKKLESAKEKIPEDDENDEIRQTNDDNEDEQWMTHKLHFEDGEPILAKDANTKGDDWFEIYDPRNPLNKRRRGETTSTTVGAKK